MTERPLSLKMKCVLVALLDEEDASGRGLSANSVGSSLGYRPGMARSGNHGRGNVARTMGVSVHVNTALTALGRRGLVAPAPEYRFALTDAGTVEAKKARGEGVKPEQAAAGRLTRHEEALRSIRERREARG